MGSFLKAEWRKLAMINYEVNQELLKEYVPYKTELDLWQGKCYVSLVGFMFLNTQVKGCKLPGHINFEEVNLRFYVKYKTEQGEEKRGVVFIKEIVPKLIITWVANKVYKEHYETMSMKHDWQEDGNELKVSYTWYKDNYENSILLEAKNMETPLKEGTMEFFIAEHYWGYSKFKNRQTTEYEVKHPSWGVYPVQKANISVDFGMVYGEEFSFLSEQKPASVFLAEGSEISVENKNIIS
ncbi:MAG: DUF2071 domain-containing protein [Flavobacteriales bacterium]|nr:DUF2071 domain-containing protein [Flavobacteriales bacterium]